MVDTSAHICMDSNCFSAMFLSYTLSTRTSRTHAQGLIYGNDYLTFFIFMFLIHVIITYVSFRLAIIVC